MVSHARRALERADVVFERVHVCLGGDAVRVAERGALQARALAFGVQGADNRVSLGEDRVLLRSQRMGLHGRHDVREDAPKLAVL